jgi:hypothetical protein
LLLVAGVQELVIMVVVVVPADIVHLYLQKVLVVEQVLKVLFLYQ